MDGYEVVLRPAAQRDLRKISEPSYGRIIAELNSLKEQPRPPGVRKLVGQDNEWRVRVGDYRILYEIDDFNRIVRIFRIAHRREVYR